MAIVLAHLEAPVAADVLQLLPSEYQEEIVYRIATLGPVSNEALEDLERLHVRKGYSLAAMEAAAKSMDEWQGPNVETLTEWFIRFERRI